MKMSRALLAFAAATALTCSDPVPAKADPWTRGFVVSSYGYAFRYGGRAGFTRGTEIEPGVDCPHGSTNFFTDSEQRRSTLARQKWYSQQEIDWIVEPPGLDQIRGDTHKVRGKVFARAISYRGYKRGIETYVNPWAAQDPGQPEVTSRIADGFNLDGKIGPNDFVSPDGEKGIDNALYRAWGCDAPWRGNGNATLALRYDTAMLDGLHTIVIRISGHQDPMNDSDATVEIGNSPDQIVRDARGGVGIDYSYRILRSARYTKLKATIKNGVVETEQVEHLHTPRMAYYYDQTGDTNFTKGKIRLVIAPDGLSATSLIGGYRDWRDLYGDASFGGSSTAGAGSLDEVYHEDHVALYYALRRNADGMYNEKTRQYDGISTAYRMMMSSAFVVDPDQPMTIPIRAGNEWRRTVFEACKTSVAKGAEALIPQDVPPGCREAAYPYLEGFIKDLSSRDFILKTLDRPHYPDGVGLDLCGYPIDDQGNRKRNTKYDERLETCIYR
ncbi:hypothetical protein [Bradyrhizobium iriomotense]|uniref:Uncharacterized protein n=1 Tax=Bradyrhizobium iriomotense TaxID=441950 RepID=A0ABQ6B5T9_9BRAD|nr:hypothetical protein [Bradyrhizobium iriomotense]GLR87578.1 hypothetical protein GCM10007857_42890 [Bradyrhizobium iriomotense]